MRAVTGILIGGISSSVIGSWLSPTSAQTGFSVTVSVALRRSPSLVLTAVTVRLLWTGPLSLARLVLTVASCVPAASDADSVAEVAV
ncbi:hypothetical protein D3C71_2012860 [compost metagenome]